VDSETLVRAAAFRLLLTKREGIELEALAHATGLNQQRVESLVERLDGAGRIRRDGTGRVIGSAGLSVVPDRHEVELEGRQFWTWCAYDILGIFGALRASGRALSPSPPNREVIQLDFVSGRPQHGRAVLFRPDADLMSGCENVYQEWCPNSNLFANRELAKAWAADHGLEGRILDLEEASNLAIEDWKPMTAGLLPAS
jgi:alkylmercury lyase